MRKTVIILAIIFFLFNLLSLHAEEKPGWLLIWSDEFDYTGLPDPTKWSFATEGNSWRWGNDEDQYYTADRLENARVADGYLTITARKENYAPGFNYTSARIHTKGKGDWRYGRFEMSAKLPGGVSMWPAFWMMPTDSIYGTWPASGEIDIMESFGFIPNNAQFSINTKSYNHRNGRLKTKRVYNKTLNDEFHLYAVEWFPDRLDFYLDEQKVLTYRKKSDNPDVWPFDQRFYIILNNAVGGEYCHKMTGGVDDSIFPQEYIVDYVRVYGWNDGFTHSLSVTASAGGRVEIVPDKKVYAPGEQVTITAAPDPGMRFTYWSGDFEGENPARSFNLLRDTTVCAHFISEDELISNGGFDQNLTHWITWSDPTVTRIAPISVDNGELKAEIRRAGNHDWQIQFSQPIALEEGKTYRLSFTARSNRNRPIRVSFNQNHPPYKSYLSGSFDLTRTAKTYTMEMTMTNPSDPESRIEFDLGNHKGTLWFDDISVVLAE